MMAVELPITIMLDQNEAAEALARHVMRKIGIERVTGFGVRIKPGQGGAWSVAVTLEPPK